MKPEDYQRAVEVCLGACELTPDTQDAFLSAACHGDDSLRKLVEALLDADRHAESFLRDPPCCLVSAALASIPSPCSPGERLGEYQILSRLGGGGMAEVFLAQDLLLDRKVALKVLPRELTAHFAWLQQLQEEARAASRLNHPNILTVYGFGNSAGVHYLATELVEGPTLRQMLDGGALPMSTAIDIAIQIASALEAAHAAGVVHRDIKPENLVRRLDGLVKVLDFGVAERVGQNDRPMKVITGTPQYMSPEQAAGCVTDARTDLFSLGLVLHEMLTGRPAFRGATVNGTLEQVLSRDPPPLSSSGVNCPRALACIVTNLLEKDRLKRLQTARQLRVELEAVRKKLNGVWTRSRLATAALVILLLAVGLQAYHSIHIAPTAAIESMAVLPLEDLSTDKSRAYFSEGITEQIIADLSRLEGLRVISLPSVVRFRQSPKPLKEIARELNVDALLTGSLDAGSKRVRISLKLTRAKPQQQLWAESYERNLGDLTGLEREVAMTIARKVQKDVPPGAQSAPPDRSPISAQARDLYYMGQYNENKGTEESYLKSIEFFKRAIVSSPSYAEAYSGLAYAYVQLSSLAFHYFSPLEGMPKAKAAALKALELDEALADAHTWLAYVKLTFDRDRAGAEREIERALALNPNSADAHLTKEWYLLTAGRFDEAFQQVLLARELDPLSLRLVNEDQIVRVGARRYQEAIDLGNRAVATEPEFVPALYFNAMAYTEIGDFPRAIFAAKNAVRTQNVFSNRLLLAHVLARAGNERKAESLIREQQASKSGRYLCPYEVGTAYVSLHRKKEAYKWLEKAVSDRVDCMIYLEVEPWMDSLRNDPEYRQLLKEMSIPLH